MEKIAQPVMHVKIVGMERNYCLKRKALISVQDRDHFLARISKVIRAKRCVPIFIIL